jgi:hypothetical protein
MVRRSPGGNRPHDPRNSHGDHRARPSNGRWRTRTSTRMPVPGGVETFHDGMNSVNGNSVAVSGDVQVPVRGYSAAGDSVSRTSAAPPTASRHVVLWNDPRRQSSAESIITSRSVIPGGLRRTFPFAGRRSPPPVNQTAQTATASTAAASSTRGRVGRECFQSRGANILPYYGDVLHDKECAGVGYKILRFPAVALRSNRSAMRTYETPSTLAYAQPPPPP